MEWSCQMMWERKNKIEKKLLSYFKICYKATIQVGMVFSKDKYINNYNRKKESRNRTKHVDN